jgi:two-component system sensor histidine kinase RegB
MPDTNALDLGRSARRLRVQTLVRLRWLAVTGQMAALLVVHFLLAFPLPFAWCLLVIAASCVLNIVLRLRFGNNHRFDDAPALALLIYDVLQLSLLLFLTGGLENPFSMLFLAPVMISAASLSPYRTLLLGICTGLSATTLVFFHLPLPWMPGQELQLPFLFTLGVWVAIISGMAFTGVYASRVAEEARQLSDALAATELVLAREQHLSQLDGLAAAAAHELGTPLATISVIATELARAIGPNSPHTDDVTLLREQAQRCRAIMAKLTELPSAGPFDHMPLSNILEEVAAPHRNFGVAIDVAMQEPNSPVGARNPGILYGLGNLLENAVDFAQERVEVTADWNADNVIVTISDDGPGFAPEVMDRIGEPYVRSSRRRRMNAGSETTGLGLGFFIAKTLLERSGASVEFENRVFPDRGAVVKVRWDRNEFERPPGFSAS